ncbi:hypothetical protein CDAR_481761 [Caerostris darwini]|uniref:Uncharacterized protein n=1 Tax=Caerostris darwini TaxID=1538125 RepID=A0AAV4UY75_9ARAC|nr:hypothetical protein CDAR_481761 [Caerostris darwini]
MEQYVASEYISFFGYHISLQWNHDRGMSAPIRGFSTLCGEPFISHPLSSPPREQKRVLPERRAKWERLQSRHQEKVSNLKKKKAALPDSQFDEMKPFR